MKIIRSLFIRGREVGDLFHFLWKEKMYFVIPFVVILIILGALLFFAQATGVAPFIYTLF